MSSQPFLIKITISILYPSLSQYYTQGSIRYIIHNKHLIQLLQTNGIVSYLISTLEKIKLYTSKIIIVLVEKFNVKVAEIWERKGLRRMTVDMKWDAALDLA